MAEMNKGIISEEALGEIAGGLNVSKEKVISTLKKVGVGIGAAAAVTAALGGTFVAGGLVEDKFGPFKKIKEGNLFKKKKEQGDVDQH